ncbi:MAG: undecaprenyl-phosphate galactose phosphotransferase WbaP [Anaerolineaceae bacterium]|nr:MAG: undecaprenyl-phosphate galactose phosphotransferase WbaP [Anaerolineaceae bacterium]
MKKQFIRWRGLFVSSIFILVDALGLYFIFRVSFFIRQTLTPLFDRKAIWTATEPLMQLGILLSIGVFFIQGLYPGYGLTAVKELERIGRSVSLTFFLLAGVSYLNKPFQNFSRSTLLFGWVLAMILFPLSHFILRNIISRYSWYGTAVVVFGEGKDAQKIVASLKRVRRLGWRPAAILPINAITYDRVKLIEPHVAIISPPANTPIESYAHILNQHFRKVILIQPTGNFGSAWVEPRDLDGQLGLEFHYHLFDHYARLLKRLVDFLGSLVLGAIMSPLFAILSLMVALDSPGPVFFYQQRLGRNLARFNVIKFRTMVLDAEQRLAELLQNDPSTRAEYETFHKLSDDPRITRVGKWLRRFSLDELPQLWNVLVGEMSLVGPRAYMPSELDDIGDYAPILLRVNPGVTGWWQIFGRHNTTFQKRLQMDEYYISNWSLWMDLYILLKTVWIVFKGQGA